MRLARTRMGRNKFHHPFYKLDLPASIPEEEKAELISKISKGNLEAAHRAVLSHVRLALNIVGRYMVVIDNTSRSDDLVSAAVEGLCHGVNKIREEGLPHVNLTGYLTENIHRFVSEHLEHFPVVRVPARTKRRHKGKVLQPATCELTEAVIEKQFDKKSKMISKIELDEILEKVIQSPMEREIIELRMEGRRDDEVASLVGLSKTTVFLIRRELENRFVTLFGDSENEH